MTTGIGFVIQANAPINQTALEKVLKATDSKRTSHTVLNNAGYAAHLKANVCPLSSIYLRNYDADGDANDWKQYSPTAYFDKYQSQVVGNGLGLQIANEPGFSPDILQKMTPFMLEAEKRNIPVSIGGFSVGTPPDSANGWGQYDGFVNQLCRRPDLFAIDCHEYWLGVPTSGMVTAQTQPGESLYFVHSLLKKEQWPAIFSLVTNAYHVGRVKHLFNYCFDRRYNRPTVDIGEAGADFVSDNATIDGWGKGLPNTNPVRIINQVRGYKSFGAFWPESVAPGQSIQQTYMDMLLWARKVVYDSIGVRSMRVYTWGNSGTPNTSTDWSDFDWNTDPVMQDEFVRRMGIPTTEVPIVTPVDNKPPPAPPPIVVTPPAPAPDAPSNRIDLQIALVKANTVRTDLDKARADLDALIESLKTLLEIKPAA